MKRSKSHSHRPSPDELLRVYQKEAILEGGYQGGRDRQDQGGMSMVSNTKEVALEQAIERRLTGLTTEELGGAVAPVGAGPFRIGRPADFDAGHAVDLRLFWEFMEATQAKELAKLKARSPADWQRRILERLDRMIRKNGVLHVLKKGLAVDDAILVMVR